MSTLSLIIWSDRSTPKVGRPLSDVLADDGGGAAGVCGGGRGGAEVEMGEMTLLG